MFNRTERLDTLTGKPQEFVYTSPHLILHRLLTPISSTQDEARSMIQRNPTTSPTLAVLADIQTNGRGTNGRSWERATSRMEADGNLYLTVCLPMSDIPFSITIFPLYVAVLVADALSKVVDEVHVKWPNDVLVGDHKLSGTLIETETVNGTTFLLVGIGINVAQAPDGFSFPRKPTCLADHVTGGTVPPAHEIGLGLAANLTETKSTWLSDEAVLSVWRSYARFNVEYKLRSTNEVVKVVGIEKDGQLRVRDSMGNDRLLMAEYMV